MLFRVFRFAVEPQHILPVAARVTLALLLQPALVLLEHKLPDSLLFRPAASHLPSQIVAPSPFGLDAAVDSPVVSLRPLSYIQARSKFRAPVFAGFGDVGEHFVGQQIFDAFSFLGVHSHALVKKVLGAGRRAALEPHFASGDLLFQLGEGQPQKGWPLVNQLVKQDPQGPDVDLESLLLPEKQLRRHVLEGAAEGFVDVAGDVGGAEVAELGLPVLRQQNVFGLDVAVHDFLLVEIFHAPQDFAEQSHFAGPGEIADRFLVLLEAAARQVLEVDDNIISGDLVVQKVDDVFLAEGLVDAQFGDLVVVVPFDDLEDLELVEQQVAGEEDFVEGVAVQLFEFVEVF